MQLIRDLIEWVASDTVGFLATVFPFLVVGLLGLYLLSLVIGYLRVSQVGLRHEGAAQPAVALPGPVAEGELPAAPRGVPYCAFDGLQFPAGARFCTSCERDLTLDCATCGATLTAGDASCYRCGTRTGADPARIG